MQETLTNLSLQMSNMEKKPANSTPSHQVHQADYHQNPTSTQNPSNIQAQTANITQTQEKELHSPSNNQVPPSIPNPDDMNLVEINRKRSQQGSPTTPPITKKLHANAHIMNDMVRKLKFDHESEKREEDKNVHPLGTPPVEGASL